MIGTADGTLFHAFALDRFSQVIACWN